MSPEDPVILITVAAIGAAVIIAGAIMWAVASLAYKVAQWLRD